MEASRFNQVNGVVGGIHVRRLGYRQELSKVSGVLRTIPVVAGQHLEGDEMVKLRDGHHTIREYLQPFRLVADFSFDPRRCEQKIQHQSLWRISGWRQTCRGQATGCLLFHRGQSAKPGRLKLEHNPLCRIVIGDGQREVKIARESRFRANGDSQSAD